MIAEELINQMIPPLKPNDLGDKAMSWMEELRTGHLPIVDKGTYLGLLSEKMLLEENNLTKPVGKYDLEGKECFVYKSQHLYDIIKTASNHKADLVAVLEEDNTFLGVVSLEDTMNAFAQTAGVQSPGGILVLSMDQRDYSLSEISRLIESNNAKILSSSLNNDPLDPQKIKLTVKINKTNLTRIIATLERFGYRIIARFHDYDTIVDEKEKVDILLKYLNI